LTWITYWGVIGGEGTPASQLDRSAATKGRDPMSAVALVTGAASGIGLVAVERLVQRGYIVAALDVSADALAALEKKHPRTVTGYPVDVRDGAAVQQLVDLVETNTGPLEHVLCSAGIARVGPTLEMDPADADLMMRVNYLGVVHLATACVPRMIKRGRGEFAVLASLTGITPPVKMACYAATKAAVIAFMDCLRYEVDGTGVTLACVCPAAVKTPMSTDFFADPAKRAKSMAITPDRVVAAIEKGLARKQFMIYPDFVARTFAFGQRLSPRLVRATQTSRFGDLV
jgi:NAD(P)-dependent dehydrogenase (short-subunit alcohol dehydrogenase family)